MKTLKAHLDCWVCEGKREVECTFNKPSFKQRALISGRCSDCGSLNRYSAQLLADKRFNYIFIEAEMTSTGRARYEASKQRTQDEKR